MVTIVDWRYGDDRFGRYDQQDPIVKRCCSSATSKAELAYFGKDSSSYLCSAS